MGNYFTSHGDEPKGKIVLPDGTVDRLREPVCVADIMLQHPNHFVAELQSLSGDVPKIMPLPADHQVDPAKVYALLPIGGKNKAAKLREARRILMAGRRGLLQSCAFAGIINSEFVTGLAKGDKGCMKEVKTEAQAVPECLPMESKQRPEFLSREFSGKGWKPSLRTIEERELERKVPHWLF